MLRFVCGGLGFIFCSFWECYRGLLSSSLLFFILLFSSEDKELHGTGLSLAFAFPQASMHAKEEATAPAWFTSASIRRFTSTGMCSWREWSLPTC